jgi:hypothetical protein
MYHGGRNVTKQLKHGRRSQRYEGLQHERLKELAAQFAKDKDPLNLLPELFHARAILVDFIERYDAWRDAILTWHQSWKSTRDEFAKAVGAFQYALRTQDPDKIRGAIETLSQHATLADEGKPRQIVDISEARNTILAIARVVQTIEDIKGNMSRHDFYRIMTQMGLDVRNEVKDEAVCERIEKRWATIRLGAA